VRPLRVRYFPVVLDWYVDHDGDQVLFAPDAGDTSNLWRMNLDPQGKPRGAPVRVTHGPGRQVRASFTRNKEGVERLAYADETLNYDVWRLPVQSASGLAGGDLQSLTDRLTPDMNPSISGDGKQAYYITARLGVWSLVRKDLESNKERILYSASQLIYNSRVAPFGSKVFFSGQAADLLAVPTTGGAIEKLCARCGSVTGVSMDGHRVLFEPNQDEHLMMFDTVSGKSVKLADRGDPHVLLDGGQFSKDGRWVAFQATNNETRASTIYVIPTTGNLPAPRSQWIQITDEAELGRDPVFAPTAPFIYFTSERDGFRCLWGRKLNPDTHVPQGDAFAVKHLHSSRLALRNRASSGNIISLSTDGNQFVFALTETTGTIWLEEAKSVR
jgi:Tol biopolymer transport system component